MTVSGCIRDTRGHTRTGRQPRICWRMELYVASRGNGLSVEGPIESATEYDGGGRHGRPRTHPQAYMTRPARQATWLAALAGGLETLKLLGSPRYDFSAVISFRSAWPAIRRWWGRIRALANWSRSGRAGAGPDPGPSLQFDTFGNVLVDPYHRYPRPIDGRSDSANPVKSWLAQQGAVPHITAADFRKLYRRSKTARPRLMNAVPLMIFTALAKTYGRMCGLDSACIDCDKRHPLPSVPILVLLAMGGDTWHGSYTCQPHAGAGHWFQLR